MKPLHALTVVEVAGSVAGAYCAKTFVDGGATVYLVGDGNLSTHQRAYLGQAKVVSQLADIDFAAVDVVIQSSAPGPLAPIEVSNDQIVHVHISPFGATGAYSHWHSTDLTDYAISGHAHLYGDPEREPLRGPADQPAVAAGLYGFAGAMAALFSRDRLGRGQTVDISHMQVMVALHQVTLLRWSMAGDVLTRMGNRYTGQGQPNGLYRCSDGWISIACITAQQIEGLLAVSDLLHLMEHPLINTPMDFQAYPEIMEPSLVEWLSSQRVDELVELLQAIRVPACPLLTPGELLNDPQLASRAFLRPLDADPSIVVPGRPFSFSNEQPTGTAGWLPGDLQDGPLAGLRVLDLARVWAGPLCAQILSQLGAEVVWVEAPSNRGPQQIPQSFVDATHQFPNDTAGERPWNRNSHLVKYSLGKQSLAIDLQTEAGREAFTRLVPGFHVLLENFSARVMPQFGLDESELHSLNPALIYLTMPGYGRSGPAEHWLAYGSCVDSHAGLSSLIGYAGETSWKGGIAWPDPLTGLHATAALLSTLWSSVVSGIGGVTIEVAQFESTVAAIGDRIVEAQVDGPVMPTGNRCADFIAQGVYPCAGPDEWIAISVVDLDDLAALATVTGVESPHLAGDTFDRDAFDPDSFDAALALYTGTSGASELAAELQEAGVAAAKVSTAPDLLQDPHLQSVDHWVVVDQPDIGPFTAGRLPISLSATPVPGPTAAPTLGQHNDQVLRKAGLSVHDVAELASANTIVTEPPH